MDILPCAPLRRSSARAGCSQGGDECGALGTSGQQSIALPRDSGNSPSAIGRKTSPRPTIGPRIRTNHSEVEKGQCFGSGSCELCRISQLFTPLRATTSIWSPALPAARTSRCTASLLLPSGWAFAQHEGQQVVLAEPTSHLSACPPCRLSATLFSRREAVRWRVAHAPVPMPHRTQSLQQ